MAKNSNQNNKKRNILLATLIPVGVLATTAAIVTPIVVSCKNNSTNFEAKLDDDSHFLTQTINFEANKEYTIYANVDVESLGGYGPAYFNFKNKVITFEPVSLKINTTNLQYQWASGEEGKSIVFDAITESGKLEIKIKTKNAGSDIARFSC